MNLRNSIVVLLFSAIAIAGCKTSSPTVKISSPSSGRNTSHKELSEEEKMNLQYIFFNANKEKITGNLDKAQELFAQCIRIDNRNDASMYELAMIYAKKKKFNDALFFASSASEINPKNNWYKLLLADLFQQTGKFNEAVNIHEKLAKENPERVDYFFNWANALLFAGKIQDAIHVFDMIEQKIGVEKEIIVQKERLYLRLGKTEKAAEEVEKLISANPSDMGAYSLLVDLYQANGMKEKVLHTIERMKQVKPDSPNIFLALAEYYRSINEKEKSFEQLKLAFSSPQLESEVKMRILSSYLPLVQDSPEMKQQALELSKLMAETHPNEAMSHAVYGDFLSLNKNFKEANEQYKFSLSMDRKNENVWQQFLVNTGELRDTEEMHHASDSAMEFFPNNPVFYLYNAIALFDKKQYEDAVNILLRGSKLVVDNNLLLSEFYSRLGDNYHELTNHPESDSFYEKALELDPKNATVLNNYSYYLSLRKEKLDEAEKMSKKSNELVPDQASFEDTYAWILYQQGKYKEAKQWLEKAMKHGGDNNGTILEHYGDVLFKLNEISAAIEYWYKAKAAGDGSDLLDKKIADKKLIE